MHIRLKDDIAQMSETEVMQLIDTLPDWRREKALRYKFLGGKRECAVAYHLLQDILDKHYDIHTQPHFLIGEHGKPSFLEYPNIHFNTSHCSKAVLCAVAEEPVGVDIEQRRRVENALLHYTMNAKEQEQIAQSTDPEMEFIKLWTAKEAVVKLTGMGLQDGIPDILTKAVRSNIHIETHADQAKGYAYSIATHIH